MSSGKCSIQAFESVYYSGSCAVAVTIGSHVSRHLVLKLTIAID